VPEIEIGRGKRGRAAYTFDNIAVVPSRRTRDPENVSTHWRIDAYSFEYPFVAAPSDSVVSPASAIALSNLGILAPLDLEGLWTRHEKPEAILAEVATLDADAAAARLRAAFSEPVKDELIQARLAEIRAGGGVVAGALSPAGVLRHGKAVAGAVDIFVIRGTTVSAEHVAANSDPLNLKSVVYELDVPVIVGGCASYQAALHLMRTGAAGVLVGFGGGSSHTTSAVLGVRVPMATAVADVAAARRDYLDESGGRYVHVIADGSVGRSGDVARAIAVGADAVVLGSPLARAVDAPAGGRHWGREVAHATLARGRVVDLGAHGTQEQVVRGPSDTADGTQNFGGALAKAMATCGYTDPKDFQRVEVVVSPID